MYLVLFWKGLKDLTLCVYFNMQFRARRHWGLASVSSCYCTRPCLILDLLRKETMELSWLASKTLFFSWPSVIGLELFPLTVVLQREGSTLMVLNILLNRSFAQFGRVCVYHICLPCLEQTPLFLFLSLKYPVILGATCHLTQFKLFFILVLFLAN